VVRVDGGLLAGEFTGDDQVVRVYRGIPYAAAPVGELRWRPPQPVVPWQGVRSAVEFGPACLQPPQEVEVGAPRVVENQSEDCLFLNVWTAARSSEERRPVMVWIHGGSFQRGEGSGLYYDGEALARKGVVVVTFNYRLNVFGFLAHPELSRESEHGVSGNYGILDQVAALRWVQRNIAAFGGDPTRVTIFGESAGSWSVCYLMATPLARGLFHRAIGESGAVFDRTAYLRVSRAGSEAMEVRGEKFAISLGIDPARGAAALRDIPAEKLAAQRPFCGPSIDGWVFPDDLRTIFSEGRQADVPLIVGFNSDEGGQIVQRFAGFPKTVSEYRDSASTRFGDLADRYLRLYPVESDDDLARACADAWRDERHAFQEITWARMMENVPSSAFFYYFSRVPPDAARGYFGAFHGEEILYVFNHLDLRSSQPYTEDDHVLADMMSSYWVNFASAGDPNTDGLPRWPAFSKQSEVCLELGDVVRAIPVPHMEGFQFFDEHFAARRTRRDVAPRIDRAEP
jgi:para-nitrobenzyl esterase